jgi:hypothetical protein
VYGAFSFYKGSKNDMNQWLEWAGKAVEVIVVPTVAAIIHLYIRFGILEGILKDKKEMLTAVAKGHADHDKRIAVMESVVAELRGLAPDLRKVVEIQAKLETIASTSERRLQMLEDHILGRKA